MIGLDTNVLIRFLVQDDPEQAGRATELIRSSLESGDALFLNQLVLCETVWVLESVYGFKRARIAQTLEQLMLGRTPRSRAEGRSAISAGGLWRGEG